MVMFPGCQCCKSCGWPQASMPSAVEVVIADGGQQEQSFQATAPNGNVQTLTVPTIAGTYLLSTQFNGSFRYSSQYFALHFFGGYNGTNLSNNWELFLEAGIHWRLRDSVMTTDRRFSLRQGGTFMEMCDVAAASTTRRTMSGYPHGFGWPNPDPSVNPTWPTGALSIAYDAGCHLPGTINYQALFDAKTNYYEGFDVNALFVDGNNHTFPLSGTWVNPQGMTRKYVGFDYAFHVLSVRYVYGSDYLPQFQDIGLTSCPPI